MIYVAYVIDCYRKTKFNNMIQRKFKIKEDVLLETTIKEVRIEDYSKLLKYNMNLRKLADDIRRSRNDEHFENFLLKAIFLPMNFRWMIKPIIGRC